MHHQCLLFAAMNGEIFFQDCAYILDKLSSQFTVHLVMATFAKQTTKTNLFFF